MVYLATNLARGNGNFYSYTRFAQTRIALRAGDVLTYRIYLDPANPEPSGGVDVAFEDGDDLRDLGLVDDRGVRSHGNSDLSAARGKWLTRRIDLTSIAGRTIVAWTVNQEGDATGRYAVFIDDVSVERADGTKVVVYSDGVPPERVPDIANGYSRVPVCVSVESALIKDGEPVDRAVAAAERAGERFQAMAGARDEVDLARRFAERAGDAHVREHVEEATAALARAEREEASPDEIQAALHAAHGAIEHAHPAMEKFTGHIVGHAHIDLQWLWEWQEGIAVTRDTFAQAAKFMDEFPGFTFSQSSSCLYAAMEEHYPDLFAMIKKKVEAGQWELVGGRVCEADTNMISEESSVRQFLYGQKYFRERFGKTAVVGWEPDTFGHTAQMPQMLKLSGCEYYYFCRAGKGKPLFWWEGLDGSRVLAFEETATKSWYNSDLSYKVFEEMLDFDKQVGSKDMLWVYGVGNHGGGPTREQIAWALEQMKSGARPGMRFSTATEFFKKLASYDLTKIPVVSGEMNPIFDGCYTTHCEIKQLNARAEARTTAAETVAAVASLGGFAYPRAELRRNWEEICFNHHHDTLPGSGHHAPYKRTEMQLTRVLASDDDIITRALESIVMKVKPARSGVNVLVFNPSGWTRSGWVETYLVKSGWDKTRAPEPEECIARGPDGKDWPVVVEDRVSRRVRFLAGDVPAYGYKVFELVSGKADVPAIEVRDGGTTVQARGLVVEFDKELGCIRRMASTLSRGQDASGEMGRLEVHWETPQEMSAWTLGKVERIEVLHAASAEFVSGPDYAEARFTYRVPKWGAEGADSPFTQRFRVSAYGEITSEVACEWNGVGTKATPNALVRVAFTMGSGALGTIATHHVPFGRVERPTDGREFPALNWVSLGQVPLGVGRPKNVLVHPGPGRFDGFTVLAEGQRGFAAREAALTMSLIRAPFEPDPAPNPGGHVWRYEIVPQGAVGLSYRYGDKSGRFYPHRAAAEFNQPLLAATVPYDGSGSAPLEWSLVTEPLAAEIMPTALKIAEDGDGLVLRMFEAGGAAREQRVVLSTGVAAAEVVNFVEDRVEALAPVEGAVELKFRPHEIKTVKMKPRVRALKP